MLREVAHEREGARAQHLDCDDLLERDAHCVPSAALGTTDTHLREKLRAEDAAESVNLHRGARIARVVPPSRRGLVAEVDAVLSDVFFREAELRREKASGRMREEGRKAGSGSVRERANSERDRATTAAPTATSVGARTRTRTQRKRKRTKQ